MQDKVAKPAKENRWICKKRMDNLQNEILEVNEFVNIYAKRGGICGNFLVFMNMGDGLADGGKRLCNFFKITLAKMGRRRYDDININRQ